jgi:hypothetical protein
MRTTKDRAKRSEAPTATRRVGAPATPRIKARLKTRIQTVVRIADQKPI